jgi:CMP-N,N'-diacetyllegionaminic acid synthase
MKERKIALIPARGGSKGIHRKNLTILAGRPLIEYTIVAALNSEVVDEIWVSSDDEEILKLSTQLGVNALFRPAELADDNASAVGVVAHFISVSPSLTEISNDVIIYLQPTSPMRNAEHIDKAIREMEASKTIGVVSVVEADKPPQKAFTIDERGCLKSLFNEEMSNDRRQDLPLCFYPNGAIYAFRVCDFISRNGFPSNGSIPYVMSCTDSIDIDNSADLKRAESAMEEKNGRL